MLSSLSTRAMSSKKLPNAWGWTVGELWGAILLLLLVGNHDMSTKSENTYDIPIILFLGLELMISNNFYQL